MIGSITLAGPLPETSSLRTLINRKTSTLVTSQTLFHASSSIFSSSSRILQSPLPTRTLLNTNTQNRLISLGIMLTVLILPYRARRSKHRQL
jgi:hypothetical protein